MAPVKFDELPKVANDLLNDDYQLGYQFKTKQKTNWDGATVTTTMDVCPPKEPAKVSWKIPKAFGVAGIVLDKLELDKTGMIKLETSADESLHLLPGLKIEAKSDVIDPANATVASSFDGVTWGATYTGIKDTQFKLDAKPRAKACTLEVCHTRNNAMVGMKLDPANMFKPHFGLRYEEGPYFLSCLAKEGFSVFNAHGLYKASNDLKFAGTYQHGGKQAGNFSFGLAYTMRKGTSLKFKVMEDRNIQAGLKHEVAEGFNVLAGCKCGMASGKKSFGLQVSIE